MNAAGKLSPALLVAAVLTLACGADQPPAPAKVAPPQVEEGTAETGAPRITADEAVHDFGAMKAADSVEHVFTIRNAGDADLEIERVQRT